MKLYSIIVRGKYHSWSFNSYLNPDHIQDYLDDGLEVYEMVNIIPEWIPSFLIKPFCILQDLWNFKWLFHIINKIKGIL